MFVPVIVPCVVCVFEVHGVIAFDYEFLVAHVFVKLKKPQIIELCHLTQFKTQHSIELCHLTQFNVLPNIELCQMTQFTATLSCAI